MGTLSQNKARKLALMNAAALIARMDLAQLFGDELYLATCDDPATNETLGEAQKYAVQQIQKLSEK